MDRQKKNTFAVADREAEVQVLLDSCQLVEEVTNWQKFTLLEYITSDKSHCDTNKYQIKKISLPSAV